MWLNSSMVRQSSGGSTHSLVKHMEKPSENVGQQKHFRVARRGFSCSTFELGGLVPILRRSASTLFPSDRATILQPWILQWCLSTLISHDIMHMICSWVDWQIIWIHPLDCMSGFASHVLSGKVHHSSNVHCFHQVAAIARARPATVTSASVAFDIRSSRPERSAPSGVTCEDLGLSEVLIFI